MARKLIVRAFLALCLAVIGASVALAQSTAPPNPNYTNFNTRSAGQTPTPGLSTQVRLYYDGTGFFYKKSDGSSVAVGGGGGTGTVTSVGLSLPAIFSVSGSPVTTSGSLTATLATQSANRVWAGPTTGAAAAPTFRTLVSADIAEILGAADLTDYTGTSGSGSTAIKATFTSLTSGDVLTWSGSNWVNQAPTSGIGGSGTVGNYAKFLGSTTTLANALLSESGNVVTVGVTSATPADYTLTGPDGTVVGTGGGTLLISTGTNGGTREIQLYTHVGNETGVRKRASLGVGPGLNDGATLKLWKDSTGGPYIGASGSAGYRIGVSTTDAQGNLGLYAFGSNGTISLGYETGFGTGAAIRFVVNSAGITTGTNDETIGDSSHRWGQVFFGSPNAVTASTPVIDASQTWNSGGVTFSLATLNATCTACAAASTLLDLQVAGVSQFAFRKDAAFVMGSGGTANTGLKLTADGATNLVTFKTWDAGQMGNVYVGQVIFGPSASTGTLTGAGNVNLGSARTISWGATDVYNATQDTILTREGAAILQLGPDAAAPVSYTLKSDDARAGTDTDTAGSSLTIAAGRGTGTGGGGSLIFQTAPVGSTGTAANTLTTALTITNTQRLQGVDGAAATPTYSFANFTTGGLYYAGSSVVVLGAASGTAKISLDGAGGTITTNRNFAGTSMNNGSASGALTLDGKLANIYKFTLTGNATSVTPSALQPNAFYVITFLQDGTGGRTVAGWTSAFKWAGGSAPTITATATARDDFFFWSDGSALFEIGRAQDVK